MKTYQITEISAATGKAITYKADEDDIYQYMLNVITKSGDPQGFLSTYTDVSTLATCQDEYSAQLDSGEDDLFFQRWNRAYYEIIENLPVDVQIGIIGHDAKSISYIDCDDLRYCDQCSDPISEGELCAECDYEDDLEFRGKV